MIEARLPDGTALQFEDGTPDAVIDRTVKSHLQSAQPQRGASESAERPLPGSVSPPPPSGQQPQSLDQALTGIQAPNIGSVSPGVADAATRIARAGVEGWQATPDTQPVRDMVTRNLGISAPLINPLIAAGGGVLGALSGGYRAAQQAGVELISPLLGPQAARDIVSIPDAFAGAPGMVSVPGRPPIPEAPRPLPRFASEIPAHPSEPPPVWRPVAPGEEPVYGREYRMNQGTGQREVNVGGPVVQSRGPVQGVPDPEPPPPVTSADVARGSGTTQPAGAQVTPASEIGLSPKEEAAYRSTAEGNKLLEPQEPGVRDAKQYLPGERVNEAEASQDVQTARELKSLRQQTPELDAKMTADENHNNNLRYNAINNAIPGQVQITAAKTARQEAMEAAKPEVFRNATDANIQPIVRDIRSILEEPENRQNTQLRQYVQPLIDRLVNPDGTPKIVDARELLSWRQDVQHLTSGAAQAADPNLSRVSGILGKILDTTDNQIEAAANGYKAKIRDEYRTRSQEIDAMEALNAERFKLFDSQNVPNYNAVQGLLRRIVDARQANDPYEPFTHVAQETLDQLWAIRDSMRRSRAVDRLGAPRGSPTSQNFGDALRAAGTMAVKAGLPALGAGVGHLLIPVPFAGEAAGLVAGQAVNHLLSQRGMAQRMQRGLELTTPKPNELMGSPP